MIRRWIFDDHVIEKDDEDADFEQWRHAQTHLTDDHEVTDAEYQADKARLDIVKKRRLLAHRLQKVVRGPVQMVAMWEAIEALANGNELPTMAAAIIQKVNEFKA